MCTQTTHDVLQTFVAKSVLPKYALSVLCLLCENKSALHIMHLDADLAMPPFADDVARRSKAQHSSFSTVVGARRDFQYC